MIAEVWRGMFGTEMLPAGAFLLLLWFVPESPCWLTKSGQAARALAILTNIGGSAIARRELAEIQTALAQEEGTLRELLRLGLRVALVVALGLAVFGQLTGVNIVVYYGPVILKSA